MALAKMSLSGRVMPRILRARGLSSENRQASKKAIHAIKRQHRDHRRRPCRGAAVRRPGGGGAGRARAPGVRGELAFPTTGRRCPRPSSRARTRRRSFIAPRRGMPTPASRCTWAIRRSRSIARRAPSRCARARCSAGSGWCSRPAPARAACRRWWGWRTSRCCARPTRPRSCARCSTAAQQVTVLGGGFIGLEVAATALALGKRVTRAGKRAAAAEPRRVARAVRACARDASRRGHGHPHRRAMRRLADRRPAPRRDRGRRRRAAGRPAAARHRRRARDRARAGRRARVRRRHRGRCLHADQRRGRARGRRLHALSGPARRPGPAAGVGAERQRPGAHGGRHADRRGAPARCGAVVLVRSGQPAAADGRAGAGRGHGRREHGAAPRRQPGFVLAAALRGRACCAASSRSMRRWTT